MAEKRISSSTHAFDSTLSGVEQTIQISVRCDFDDASSSEEAQRFAFSYTVTITNRSQSAATLVGRHWTITDGENRVREVHGAGVVGEQPCLRPGESFQYTSGVILETPVGSMSGYFHMLGENGSAFEAEIPAFSLAKPDMVH
ncbi:MAG: Co2+/Mg2+ efflux protein ApaG [Legionellales bacterium]|nr:Co2+/Mg2+ efflux protein ApaG [Legionellales bacterium]|tara:strand:+ start:701 stop:1129 length:429 start_codon:yes stop_codon:yes gene_type:complete